MSAIDRRLVILIENGGIDLGLPTLVDKLLSSVPGASVIPDSYREKLVEHLREKLKSITDHLLESAELSINRYSAAKPDLFGDVTILRDGTSSYQDLKSTLLAFAREGKIVDLIILTHGSTDSISVPGGIDGQKIRDMKVALGRPLTIRSVYMMNCVGSSLNQAWLDAGAKVSSGALRNNYLPEPTTFFFWKNWQGGQSFESAVTSAYRRTINLMNETVRGFVSGLPVPESNLLAQAIDFENLDFVRDSAPVIQGQRTLTINSDDLSFTGSISSSLATTILPVSLLRSFGLGEAAEDATKRPRTLSQQAIDFITNWDKPWQTQSGIAPDVLRQSLVREATQAQQIVNDRVSVPLNQNQNDALVSFVYSVGDSGFQRSTLLSLLNQGNHSAAPGEMKKWIKIRQNGVVVDLPDLVRRREAEGELFQKAGPVTAQSLEIFPARHSYLYQSPSTVATQQALYSTAQNPAAFVIAGMEVADAVQIGLAGVAIVQTQVSASQGSFTLVYDKAQRLLTPEARVLMPGAQSAKKSYSLRLFYLAIGRLGTAEADVIIEWEGNAYGEIATPVIRRKLATSTDWSKSAANFGISKIDRLPPEKTDPRTYPITYTYEGTYDPLGNGYFEISGEFQLNAFGGLKFNRHEVVSRSLADWAIGGTPQDKVQKGPDVIVPVPAIPQEQIDYLRTKLP